MLTNSLHTNFNYNFMYIIALYVLSYGIKHIKECTCTYTQIHI